MPEVDSDRRVTEATEHLVHLPRMSTTAGVGSQEYVAINTTAVIALLLGMASVLAIMTLPLLAVPLVGVITAAFALNQISQSNGTQTGRHIALGGLFLSVGIGSFVVSSSAINWAGQYSDKKAIAQLCTQFGDDMKLARFDSAYQLCSQRFQSRVDREEFVSKLQQIQEAYTPYFGKIVGTNWNGLAQFNSEPDSGTVTAWGYIQLHFEKTPNIDEKGIEFRKSGTKWFIDGLEFFPPKKTK